MYRINRAIAAIALVTAAGIAGASYAQMDHGGHGVQGSGATMTMENMGGMMEAMMPAEGDTDSTKAFKKADMDMMHGMAVEYTGNADVDFRLKMIPHHQGAIDMANVALRYSTDPETKALAEQIISAQEREIAEMQAWLEENGR